MNTSFKKLLRQSAVGLSIMLGAAALTPAAAQADWGMDDLIGPAAGAIVGAMVDKNHRAEHAAIGAAVGGAAQQVYKHARSSPPPSDQRESSYPSRGGGDTVNAGTLEASGKASFRTTGFGSSAYNVTVNGNPVKALQAIGRLTQSTIIFPAEEASQMVQQGESHPISAKINVSRYSPESALSGLSVPMENLGWSCNVVRKGSATAIIVGSPDRVLDISQRIENGQLALPSANPNPANTNTTHMGQGINGTMADANSTMNSVSSTAQTVRSTVYTIQNLGR